MHTLPLVVLGLLTIAASPPVGSDVSGLLSRVRAASALPAPRHRRSIRERAGVSQREMATALGVHPMTLNRWERGVIQPRSGHAADYSKLLEALQEATG